MSVSDRSDCPCEACVEYRTFMQACNIYEDSTRTDIPSWVVVVLESDKPLRECCVEMEAINHALWLESIAEEAIE